MFPMRPCRKEALAPEKGRDPRSVEGAGSPAGSFIRMNCEKVSGKIY